MQAAPRRLPNPEFLLTFDAAAQHLSFTRAAEERFVTQSAVSRQIRALEDDLGVTLFERRHRALALTAEGAQLARTCRSVVEQLQQTVEQLRGARQRRVVTITTTPGLAALWLIPRLAGFTSQHPDVDVRIDASFERRDLVRDGIEIAIRYGRVDAPVGPLLFEESALPVCSPALRATGPALARPEDLAQHTLLRLDDRSAGGPLEDWAPWLAASGVGGLQPRAMLTFSNYDAVISAAVHGQGVAMGRRPLVDDLLNDGRLVAPLQGGLASPRAYFVQVREDARRRREVCGFERWLLEQARTAH
ncbi:MAG TPA: LysR substrate-binding domain-containing protein [Quisquiliibacterium sp.]|nr:LysR substrate-binding domain-containing protein [Quisquiliibacterium sp.]HQN10993.1 LysR substrate-binding domain-containing protein [Quisquiliibacterium sp.]